MIIKGEFSVAAPRAEAWRHLSDLPALAPLLPGCDSIQPAGDGVYQVGAQARVGPIKVRLAGRMQVVEAQEPDSMRLRIEGQDAITASHVRAAIHFRLVATAPAETAVAYEADVLIAGRLGTIGQGIMRETVATMLEELVRRLNARIRGEPIEATGMTALGVKVAARTLKGVIHRRGNEA